MTYEWKFIMFTTDRSQFDNLMSDGWEVYSLNSHVYDQCEETDTFGKRHTTYKVGWWVALRRVVK